MSISLGEGLNVDIYRVQQIDDNWAVVLVDDPGIALHYYETKEEAEQLRQAMELDAKDAI